LKLNVLGPPSGFGAVLLAAQLQSGIPLSPWGVWYLDPATSMLATVLPLDGKGVGSLSVKLPAARFPALTAGAQVATFSAADFTLTNWAAFANWANATGSEIATARFDGARDVLQVSAKGMPYATALDVTMRNPGGGWIELGTFKTPPPPTLIAWTKLRSGLRPGGEVEVWRGPTRLLLLR
jgi:hypothetical protein